MTERIIAQEIAARFLRGQAVPEHEAVDRITELIETMGGHFAFHEYMERETQASEQVAKTLKDAALEGRARA